MRYGPVAGNTIIMPYAERKITRSIFSSFSFVTQVQVPGSWFLVDEDAKDAKYAKDAKDATQSSSFPAHSCTASIGRECGCQEGIDGVGAVANAPNVNARRQQIIMEK